MTAPRDPIDCDAVRDLAPLFVTGALEPAEAEAVRDHLAGCDDAHPELRELVGAATALLETVEPVDPPPALKARLLAAAEADLRTGRHPSIAAGSTTSPGPASVPGSAPGTLQAQEPGSMGSAAISLDRERARRRPSPAWLTAAAAIILVVVLGAWNLALRGQIADAQAYRDGVVAALELAAQPGSETARLVTADGTAAGIAVVGADGTVRLAVRGLAPTSGTQVYTAWGIAGEAAPVAIADMQVSGEGVGAGSGLSPVLEPGMVLALTLEPGAGATTPTLPIVASGVAGATAG